MTLNPVRLLRAFRSHVQNLDRGAALVEAAIAIPLLLLVIMGSVEFGFAWEAKSSSTSGVRTGILRAATLGDRPETDMRVIQSIIGEVGRDNYDRIEWIVVFDASGTDDQAAVNDCVAGTGGRCVFYPATFINQVATTPNAVAFQAANFDSGLGGQTDGSYTCETGNPDATFCSGKRTEFNSDLEVGIAIKYNHEWFTGIFPFDPPSFQDFTVTSTFTNDGASISPSGASVPSSIGEVFSNTAGGPTTVGFTGVTIDDLNDNPPGGTNPIEFLGRFGSETITLTVDTPQEHTQVCITFELYILGSWDLGTTDPADFFSLDVNTDDGVVEKDNVQFARGDDLGDLDYDEGSWSDQGRVEVITQCADHIGSSVSIDFSAALTGDISNEAWAIGDVTVNVQN